MGISANALAQTAALDGAVSRPVLIATNLKGDEVLWLGETYESGQRFVTSLVRFRYFTQVLDVEDAASRADLQIFDCATRTRTLAGVRVFRLVEGIGQMAKQVDIAAAQRVPEPVFGPNSDGLVQAVYRVACEAKSVVAKQGDPWQGGSSSATPITTEGPIKPGAAQIASADRSELLKSRPDSNPGATTASDDPVGPILPAPPIELAEPEGPPYQPIEVLTPPPRTGAADQPVFGDYVFTLRTLAQLADLVYLNESDVAKTQAVITALEDALTVFDTRGDQYDAYRKSVTREAFQQGSIELANDLQRLGGKADLLRREGLERVPLPKMTGTMPSFRAELYRHTQSRQHVLVFRGSAEVYDWISNLWLGVDLGEIEAPHYASARQLVGLLAKAGVRPLLVGHSLGGGMAQYAAHTYNLKVVAFNSSPLPQRYLPKTSRFSADNARIFSALELPAKPPQLGQPDQRQGDPVSLGVANVAKWASKYTDALKASHHLVVPICLLTYPDPRRTELEDMKMAGVMATMFTGRPVYTALTRNALNLVGLAGGLMAIDKAAKALVDDPVWRRHKSETQEVGKQARNRVAKVVVAKLMTAQATLQLGKWMLRKNMGKTALEIAAAMAEAAAAAWVNRMLEVHSMERFVRGLEAYGDTSPYKQNADSIGPCAQILSVY